MADIVGQIAIQIGADISPLTADLSKAQGQISKFGAAAQSSASGGMRAFGAAGAIMGGAIAAAAIGLAAMTKRIVDNAGALHDMSVATGVSVKSLQAMTQVAEEAGSSQEELVASLKRMQNNIAGLTAGTKAQVDAFANLGLGVRDLAGLSADEQFARIAEAISRLPDPTERTAAAMDVFGKTGANLLSVMNGYSAAVAEAAQHQQDLGIALSDTDASKLDDLGDSAGRLKDAALGAATQFAVTFGPSMQLAVDAITSSMLGLNAALKDFHDWLTTSEAEAALARQVIALAEVNDELGRAKNEAGQVANELQLIGNTDLATALNLQIDTLDVLFQKFNSGEMSADDYAAAVNVARQRIIELLDEAAKVNGIDVSVAKANFLSLADAIFAAVGQARALAGVGASAVPSGDGPHTSGDMLPVQPTGIVHSPRPHRPGIDSGVPDTRGGGGGGGGGSSLADDLKALQERLASEAEVEMQAYADAQKTLEEALAQKLLTQEQYQADLEKLQRDHSDRMASIDAGSYGDGAQRMGAYFGVLADTFQSGNERLQKIGRVFGAAEALTNAWRAYTQTLADPSLPFFAKFAAAASVLSAGLGAVNAIRSGGGGGASGGAGAGAASPAAAASPAIANIVVHGDTLPTTSFQSLIDQLNAAFKQGYTLNLVNQ